MRPTAFKLTAALFILVGITQSVGAQDPINVVTTAVPFLRISPDARAGGMGELAIATTPDANSSFWNLGKVPFNTNKGGISLSYTPWLKDILSDVYLAALAGYYKFDDLQAINGSVRYFSLGNIQFTDNLGNDLNTFRPREFGIDLGYSRKLSEKIGIGVALRYIYSNLAGGAATNGSNYKPGSAVAGDLAFYYEGKNDIGTGFAFGVATTNLGSKIAYTDNADQKDFIPANLGIGTSYTKVIDDQNL